MSERERPSPFGPLGRPVALAHRGGAGEAVENSATAFQHALDLGYRWIETDVRASRDGVAFVFHDERLDRTTDATGPIAATTAADLASSRLADGTAPLTLAEALSTWPELAFNVDVKSPDGIGPFLRAVAEADAWHRVCAASFSTRRLRELRVLAGAQLATSMGGTEAAALVGGRVPRSSACAAQLPRAVAGRHLVTRRLVDRAHAAGIAVQVWVVDDPAEMHRLLDLGADGIITDRPTLLRSVLRERGDWPAS